MDQRRRSPYRYMDVTEAVTFGVRMAHYALDNALIAGTVYLQRFDKVRRRIDARFDLLSKDLHALIRMAYSRRGVLSANRRKQYVYLVQPDAYDAFERAVRDLFFADGASATDD